MSDLIKIPKLSQLVESNKKQNELTVLLNQSPPSKWIKEHPFSKSKYLKIETIEYLLNSIFPSWSLEVKDLKLVANSVVVTVKLTVTDPLTKKDRIIEGVGAQNLQLNSGAKACDYNELKSNSVQLATPMAKTYALKDAAQHLGRLFGRDLNRTENNDYNVLIRPEQEIKLPEKMQIISDKEMNEVLKNLIKDPISILKFLRSKDLTTNQETFIKSKIGEIINLLDPLKPEDLIKQDDIVNAFKIEYNF